MSPQKITDEEIEAQIKKGKVIARGSAKNRGDGFLDIDIEMFGVEEKVTEFIKKHNADFSKTLDGLSEEMKSRSENTAEFLQAFRDSLLQECGEILTKYHKEIENLQAEIQELKDTRVRETRSPMPTRLRDFAPQKEGE